MTNQFTVPDHPVNFRIWCEQSRQQFIESTAAQAKAHLHLPLIKRDIMEAYNNHQPIAPADLKRIQSHMHQLSAWLRAHSIEVKDGSEFYRIYSLVNC